MLTQYVKKKGKEEKSNNLKRVGMYAYVCLCWSRIFLYMPHNRFIFHKID